MSKDKYTRAELEWINQFRKDVNKVADEFTDYFREGTKASLEQLRKDLSDIIFKMER